MNKNNKEKRLKRIKQKAKEILESTEGQKAIRLISDKVDYFVVNSKEAFAIKIVLDEIAEEDKALLESLPTPEIINKEIWFKEKGRFQRHGLTKNGWIAMSSILYSTKKLRKEATLNHRGVYFIFHKKRNLIKIGYSCNPQKRFRDLNKEHFGDLEFWGMIETDMPIDVEQALHEKFKTYRVTGEWFQYSQEIKEYIQNVREHHKTMV